jgi:hypothetical protein
MELDDEAVVELGKICAAACRSTPVFDGAREKDIVEMLERAV